MLSRPSRATGGTKVHGEEVERLSTGKEVIVAWAFCRLSSSAGLGLESLNDFGRLWGWKGFLSTSTELWGDLGYIKVSWSMRAR